MLIPKKKKFAFNVLVNPFLDTWKCLPNHFEMTIDDKPCVINMTHAQPSTALYDGKSNDHGFDLIITNQDDIDVFDRRKVVIPRYRKSLQAKFMDDESRFGSFSDFINIRTMDLMSLEGGFRNLPLLNPGRWVLKPNYGARGVALLFFTVDHYKNWSLTSALKKLNDAFEKAEKEKTLPVLSDDECQFVAGDYRDIEEVRRMFWSERGWCLQHVVENVKEEYRVITGENEICFILERPTHKVGSQQVVSAEKDVLKYSISKFSDIRNVQPWEVIPKQAAEFIVKHIPHFNSVDLFVTDDNRWGIFEYSNQFYLEDIPQTDVLQVHEVWLQKLIKSKYILED